MSNMPGDKTPQRSRKARRDGFAVIHGGGRGLFATSLVKTIRKRRILRGVSLHVRRGEAVALLGPNGAGKTTTFHILTGLLRADEGGVQVDGYDVSHLPMYQRARLGLGYLPQEASVFRGLTVADNIMAVLEVAEADPERRHRMLDDLLAQFSISHLREANASSLSGGERRRTEIARCLAALPRYILLDEPLAGIDPIAVNDLRYLIAHLKDRGIGVLMTDHNVRDTLHITDRSYILHNGEIIAEGAPRDIIADRKVRSVYLGQGFHFNP